MTISARGLLLAAWEELSANWVRTLLSMISVVAGVAALASIIALGAIGQTAFRSAVEREVGRAATIEFGTEERGGGTAELDEGLLARFIERLHRYGVEAATPLRRLSLQADAGRDTGPLTVFAAWSAYEGVRRFEILDGRWLADSDGLRLAPVLAINESARTDLGVGVGATVRLNTSTPVDARVIGVLDDGLRDPTAYGYFDVIARWSPPVGLSETTVVAHARPTDVAQLVELLDRDIAQPQDLTLLSRRIDDAAGFTEAFGLLQAILGIVAALSLIVGTLGILNVGLAVARQRTREFGVRRSFGATRADLFAIVLTEALLTSGVAGIIGIVLAVVVTAASRTLLLTGPLATVETPVFPLAAVAAGAAAAIAVGVLAGCVPAWQAARVDVIRAIRD